VRKEKRDAGKQENNRPSYPVGHDQVLAAYESQLHLWHQSHKITDGIWDEADASKEKNDKIDLFPPRHLQKANPFDYHSVYASEM